MTESVTIYEGLPLFQGCVSLGKTWCLEGIQEITGGYIMIPS